MNEQALKSAPVSQAVRRRNPHIYAAENFRHMIQRAEAKCGEIDPERPVIMDTDSVKDLGKLVAKGLRPSTDEAKLNKTELAYWHWLQCQDNLWIGLQCITLKMGHDLRLTPDCWALSHEGLRAIDVKGFQREDALIKMRIAARLFPFIHFVIVKKDGAGWIHNEVKP